MVAEIIQSAVTPVFVLVAIGNMLNLLSTRLGRIVDRSRTLQTAYTETVGAEHDMVVEEMRFVDRRIALIGKAIWLLVLSALCTGVTVIALFIDGLTVINMAPLAAITFTIGICLLLGSLWLFLQETRQASAALRVPADYLELDRKT